MKAYLIADAIGEAREEYVLDAETAGRRKTPVYLNIAAAAACLAVVSILAMTGIPQGPGDYELSEQSREVRVFNVEGDSFSAEYSLIPLTAEEIFTKWNTAIFRGVVTDIQNIDIDMNGMDFPHSILSVQVTRVLRGNLRPGDTVKILVDIHIADAAYVDEFGVIARTRVGMEGIFMPTVYDENSLFGANGAWLYLLDIAPCGLADGARFCFLKDGEELVYFDDGVWDENDFQEPYAGLRGARTLEDVEAYIEDMLEKTAEAAVNN